MILSDCTDRNVAGVNESSFLYQSCYKLIVIDANLLFKWMHAEFFFYFFMSFTINSSPSNPRPSYSFLFVVSSWFLSPSQNQYFEVSRCSEILFVVSSWFLSPSQNQYF